MMPFTLSARNLGALALADACPRCYWLKLRTNFRTPFAIFPGIFSSIDSYTKHVVHNHFDRDGQAPPWLAELDAVRYLPPPSWRQFNRSDAATGITLRGGPDAMFIHPDGTLMIADYKTSRLTNTQDALLPLYTVQLNVYAWIADAHPDYPPVRDLALLYFEPCSYAEHADAAHTTATGFAMDFDVAIKPIALQPATLLPPLLAEARRLHDLPSPPAASEKCSDCSQLDALFEHLYGANE